MNFLMSLYQILCYLIQDDGIADFKGGLTCFAVMGEMMCLYIAMLGH